MNSNATPPMANAPRWRSRQTCAAAALALALGVAAGVFVARKLRNNPPPMIAAGEAHSSASPKMNMAQMTPERLKTMADKEAEPLLAELNSKPNDPALLARLGYIYYATHSFKEASTYLRRSVDLKEDGAVRTELGRAYYYSGDPARALAEFERVLKSDPDNVNALFNVGMIRWQKNLDADGAIAAWRQIIERHPDHPRRAELERLIAQARQHRTLRPAANSELSAK